MILLLIINYYLLELTKSFNIHHTKTIFYNILKEKKIILK